MTQLINFTDKKIAILGASSGIGRETAITLSTLGARIIIVARRQDKLEETLAQLHGNGHAYYTTDISVVANIEDLFKSINEEQGALDGVVYCAGINTILPLMQLKPEKLRATFDINFFSFVETVRQVARRGRYNPRMRIVAVSSNAAVRGDKAHTAYSASKAAMNAAIRCLAKELAAKEIYINAVAPAVTNTEIYKQYFFGSDDITDSEKDLLKRQYLGLIEPKDVAETIAYLLSPAARMITGITLPVDGGLSTN